MDILYDFPQPVGCQPGTLSFIIICYVCQSVEYFQSKVFTKISLHIKKKGANSEGTRWAKPLTFLNAMVVPTPEPVLLFSICEIK